MICGKGKGSYFISLSTDPDTRDGIERMVYTVKNVCIEETGLCYNDVVTDEIDGYVKRIKQSRGDDCVTWGDCIDKTVASKVRERDKYE